MSDSVDDDLIAIKHYVALLIETRDPKAADALRRLIHDARRRLADTASKASVD